MAFLQNVNLLGPCFTSLISLSIALVVFIFGKQPEPYMDEVFHIPQVQKYCAHRFDKWDPMITTLPGLYFCSWAFVEFLAAAFGQEVKAMCMPLFLRMVNILFNIGNIWVIYRIVRKLNEMKQAPFRASEVQCVLFVNLSYLYCFRLIVLAVQAMNIHNLPPPDLTMNIHNLPP